MTYLRQEDCGGMTEQVGNKRTRFEDGGIEFTQDVLIQRFKDGYAISENKQRTPTDPGTVLENVKKGEEAFPAQIQSSLRSGIGEMIHGIQCVGLKPVTLYVTWTN